LLAGSPSLATCALALCTLLGVACSKQGEGERCDTNSGNLDCESGLICRGEAQERGVALCCPPDDTQATVDACRAGAQLPPDEGTPVTPVTDAGDGGP
jgi:hypothetical protein